MSEPAIEILGTPLVHAIDAFFDARDRYIQAMQAQNYDAARIAEQESRAALITWMSLLVNRVDSRASRLLVEYLTDVEDLKERVAKLEHERGKP